MNETIYKKACDSLEDLAEIMHQHLTEHAEQETPFLLFTFINGQVQTISNVENPAPLFTSILEHVENPPQSNTRIVSKH